MREVHAAGTGLGAVSVNRPNSPYKFLDPYGIDDKRFFFGRERETRTLLADVLVGRLVVLFAKTGTGKTSLINAGVRPRLDQLGYRTVFVRVLQDPTRSAREEMAKVDWIPRLPRATLSDQLTWLARKVKAPIVVFFDQFEEFFVYLMAEAPEKAQSFIQEVARMLKESGDLHVVFSLREEFFVDLDAFRDEIPTIFHNDSNLRLRWFDPDQAHEAIVGPAREIGVEDQGDLDELADRITVDLQEGGKIEPARLQIVCSTLWREGQGGRMRAADYDRLGGASQIVARRLEEDVGGLSDGQLRLFERLLPELRTRYGTKYLRGVEELAERLESDPKILRELLERLKDARLLDELAIHEAHYIEWTTDYLAERTDYMRMRARAILYRRLLDGLVAAAGSGQAAHDDPSLAACAWGEGKSAADLVTREDFGNLSREASELGELSREDATVALGAALAYGTYTRQWFDEASRRGVDVWGIVRYAVRPEQSIRQPAESAVQLLGELADREEAVILLGKTLDDPELATSAFNVLTRVASKAAVEVLERAVQDDAKAGPAIDALRRMRTTHSIQALARALRRGGPIGLRAGTALNTLATEPERRQRGERVPTAVRKMAREARAALAEVLADEAATLLIAALNYGSQMRFWFDQARECGVDVWEILHIGFIDPQTPPAQVEGSLNLLRELPDEQASELLDLAAQQQRLKEAAESALEARDERERSRERTVQLARQTPSSTADEFHESNWDVLLASISEGKCLPIIGAGASGGALPTAEEIAAQWAAEYRYPLEDWHNLARVTQYMAVQFDPLFPKEALVNEILRASPTHVAEVHRVLARLNLPVYLTTSFDDLMTQALRSQGKDPRLEICRWNARLRSEAGPGKFESDPDFEPTPAQPLVFHLYGHVRVPDSLVLTEDDYLDFLVAASRENRLLPSSVRRAVATSSLVLIGYGFSDVAYQVLNRVLLREASLRRFSLNVTTEPADSAARDYVSRYFRYSAARNMQSYWGGPDHFAAELGRRLDALSRD
jgi:hypothetical protein